MSAALPGSSGRAGRSTRGIGGLILGACLVSVPFVLACGGGEPARERPVARAAEHGGGGTYYGGGGGSSGPPIGVGGGMRVSHGGGGAVTEAMLERRRRREERMRERLGPVRLTAEGRELWPLYEPAVRRMEREVVGRPDLDNGCERAMAAAEVFTEDINEAGDAIHIAERAREARCRGMSDEDPMARCAVSEYREANPEECDPIIARGERLHRNMADGEIDPAAIGRGMAPGRAAARRAGLIDGPEEEPEAAVLPGLNLPTRGDRFSRGGSDAVEGVDGEGAPELADGVNLREPTDPDEDMPELDVAED